MVNCCICGLTFKKITNTHLNKRHNLSSDEFLKRYPKAKRALAPWNRGKTKYNHNSLMKFSQRLIRQKKWNFSNWQQERKERLKQRRKKALKRNSDLAELIGITLGDGSLTSLPRTEALRVVCNSKHKRYIERIAILIQKVFDKRPRVSKRKGERAADIVLYRNDLSAKLNIPCGNKIKNRVKVPKWIKQNRIYSINCLKGLFETDGCFQENGNNYTSYIEFKNNYNNLLNDVYQMLNELGYHPQFGKNYVRLARTEETFNFKNLIRFRNY